MKGINSIKVFSVFLVVSYLLSACAGAEGAAPTSSTGSDKILARPVVYMGVVEDILDDQWIINGITLTVDPSVVRDGPFNVGERVKVEAVVNEDGSLTVSGVEAVDPGDTSTLPELGNENDDNSNDDNANADNSNDGNVNDSNFNDTNSNDASVNSNDAGSTSNSNDDNGSASNSNDDNSGDDSGANSNDDDDDDDNSNGSNSNDDNDDDDDSNSNDDDDNDNNSND